MIDLIKALITKDRLLILLSYRVLKNIPAINECGPVIMLIISLIHHFV